MSRRGVAFVSLLLVADNTKPVTRAVTGFVLRCEREPRH